MDESEDDVFLDDMKRTLANLLEEPYHAYWYHLGRFIHTFAQAESRLISMLRTEAKVSKEIGGVLFHGSRIDGAKETLNRILDATSQSEKKQRLERPLAQISSIATIRNNIIHWGAMHDGTDELLVSNASKYPLKPKSFRISPSDLENMCKDLHKINVWISLLQMPVSSDVAVWNDFLQQPWLYTPPRPYPPDTPTHQDRQSPKRQRGASRKSPPPQKD